MEEKQSLFTSNTPIDDIMVYMNDKLDYLQTLNITSENDKNKLILILYNMICRYHGDYTKFTDYRVLISNNYGLEKPQQYVKCFELFRQQNIIKNMNSFNDYLVVFKILVYLVWLYQLSNYISFENYIDILVFCQKFMEYTNVPIQKFINNIVAFYNVITDIIIDKYLAGNTDYLKANTFKIYDNVIESVFDLIIVISHPIGIITVINKNNIYINSEYNTNTMNEFITRTRTIIQLLLTNINYENVYKCLFRLICNKQNKYHESIYVKDNNIGIKLKYENNKCFDEFMKEIQRIYNNRELYNIDTVHELVYNVIMLIYPTYFSIKFKTDLFTSLLTNIMKYNICDITYLYNFVFYCYINILNEFINITYTDYIAIEDLTEEYETDKQNSKLSSEEYDKIHEEEYIKKYNELKDKVYEKYVYGVGGSEKNEFPNIYTDIKINDILVYDDMNGIQIKLLYNNVLYEEIDKELLLDIVINDNILGYDKQRLETIINQQQEHQQTIGVYINEYKKDYLEELDDMEDYNDNMDKLGLVYQMNEEPEHIHTLNPFDI